jgi:hypothetical protein
MCLFKSVVLSQTIPKFFIYLFKKTIIELIYQHVVKKCSYLLVWNRTRHCNPPPPINIEQGWYILRKGYFHWGEGEGQALADRYQAFKIHHLGRQSLYIHCLIIDITSFKCLSLYCMSVPDTASYIRGWMQMVLTPNDLFSWNNKYSKYMVILSHIYTL